MRIGSQKEKIDKGQDKSSKSPPNLDLYFVELQNKEREKKMSTLVNMASPTPKKQSKEEIPDFSAQDMNHIIIERSESSGKIYCDYS